MRFIYSNNATTLVNPAVPISVGDASITLSNGAGALFPVPGVDEQFALVFEDRRLGLREIAYCTSRSGDVLQVLRGQEGTSAMSWPEGSTISHRMTAASLAGFYEELDALLAVVDDGYLRLDGGNTMTGDLKMEKANGPLIQLDNTDQATGLDIWQIGVKGQNLIIAPQSIGDLATTGGLSFTRDASGIIDLKIDIGTSVWSDDPPERDSVITKSRGDLRYAYIREDEGHLQNEFELTNRMIEKQFEFAQTINPIGPDAPAITFMGDTNTGFYLVEEATIGVTMNGVLHYRFESDGVATVSSSVLTQGNANALFGLNVQSAPQGIGADGATFVNSILHGVGGMPDTWEVYLECLNNIGLGGFAVGDYVPVSSFFLADGTPAMSVLANATTLATHGSDPAGWRVRNNAGTLIDAGGTDPETVGTQWQIRYVASRRNITP